MFKILGDSIVMPILQAYMKSKDVNLEEFKAANLSVVQLSAAVLDAKLCFSQQVCTKCAMARSSHGMRRAHSSDTMRSKKSCVSCRNRTQLARTVSLASGTSAPPGSFLQHRGNTMRRRE